MYLKVGAGYRGRGESEYPKYQCPNLLNPLVRRRHLFGYFTICNLGSLYIQRYNDEVFVQLVNVSYYPN